MREEKQGEKEELFPSSGWEESRKQEVEVKMSNLPGLAVQGQSARWWLLVLVPQGVTETTFASGPQRGGDTSSHLPASAVAPRAQPVPELSGKT